MHFVKRYITVCLFIATLLCGGVYGKNTDPKIDSFDRAIANARTDTDRVKIMLEVSKYLDCIDTALQFVYVHKAMELSKKIKWDKGIYNVYIRLGDIYTDCRYLDNYDTGVKCYHIAFNLAKSAGDTLMQIQALDCEGRSFYNIAHYRNALNCFKQELVMLRDVGGRIGTMGNIGLIYSSIGDYAQSLIYYDSSLKILEEHLRTGNKIGYSDTSMLGGLLTTIAEVYISMNQYDKALENYTRAYNLKISKLEQEQFVKILSLMGIANSYKCKKDSGKAIENYNMALELCTRANALGNEAAALNQLGVIYLDAGDVTKALYYTDSALRLIEKHAFVDQQPLVYTTLGEIYTAQKQYSGAVKYLQKAIAISKASGARVNEKDAWEALSKTYKAMGEPGQALDAYQNFIAIRDSVFNIEKANELTRIDLQDEYTRQKQALALETKLKMQKQRTFTYTGFAGLAMVLLLSFFIYRGYKQERKANVAINAEKQVSEKLLLNILPEEVAKELKAKGNVDAKQFDHVTVLFTDFVNFTSAGERLTPRGLVEELDTCFKVFDGIVGKYNIEKIKTVGDAYLAVSGLPHANPNHATDMVSAAIEMRDFMIARKQKLGDMTFNMRIGINSGTVVAGIVGVKKFAYDIWGDTVNIAARMEQLSEAGKINISPSTYELVKDKFTCEYRGEIDAKNKGKMEMYFVS